MKRIILCALVLALLLACAPTQPKRMMEETAEQKAMEKEAIEKGNWTPEQIAQMEKDELIEKEHEEATEKPRMMEPGLIGGGVSRYYDWDKAKFDQVVADGKTIYLEFSADWCPACQNQEPQLIAGFAELNDPNVVGFKIHYKDDQSTDEHNALIQQYQIAYQHTKVVLKGGKQVLKSPEAWTKDKFLEEMRKLG